MTTEQTKLKVSQNGAADPVPRWFALARTGDWEWGWAVKGWMKSFRRSVVFHIQELQRHLSKESKWEGKWMKGIVCCHSANAPPLFYMPCEIACMCNESVNAAFIILTKASCLNRCFRIALDFPWMEKGHLNFA